MSMVFISILLMSATGGLLVLCLSLLRSVTESTFNSTWHYRVSILTVLFLLIPIGVVGGSLLAGVSNAANREVPNVPVILNEMITVRQSTVISKSTQQALSQTDTAAAPVITAKAVLSTLPYIWLIGVFAFIIWQGIRLVKFKKRIVRTSLPVEDTAKISVLNSSMVEMGVKGRLHLFSSNIVKTPMLTGLFKTYLILPEVEMTDRELAVILKHELTHFKRRDLWIKSLALAANAIHWFNPAAYRLVKNIDTFSELSCDEKVVSDMDMEQRRFYGETILNVLCRVVSQHSGVYATLAESKKGIEKRLTKMMSFRKNSKRIALISVAATILLCFTGFAAASIMNITGEQNAEPEIRRLASEWAEALKTRDGKPRYDMMNETMREKFIEQQKQKWPADENDIWDFHIGGSSPWVENYEITVGGMTAKIVYLTMASDPAYYNTGETITFGWENGKLVVVDYQTDYIDKPVEDASTLNTPEQIISKFTESVAYDPQSGALQFTTPETLPAGYKLYIHVSGRLKMGDGAMSFHAFETETENYSWLPGKTYTHEIGVDSLLESLIVVGFVKNSSTEIEYETTVEVSGEAASEHSYFDGYEKWDVESSASDIKKFIEAGDKWRLSNIISYPITVIIDGQKTEIDNELQFVEEYDKIANPAFIDAIKKAPVKDLFSNYMGVMIGNGEIWFGHISGKDGLWIYAINNGPGEIAPTEDDFLNSEEGAAFQSVAHSAAKAMLSADAKELANFILNPKDASTSVRGLMNVFDNVENMSLVWSIDSIKSDNEINASYRYALKGEDSFSYVTLELVKVEDTWKVRWLGIEK